MPNLYPEDIYGSSANRPLRQASDTRRVVLGAGALDALDETFAQCFENAPVVAVADESTFAAAGRAVQERLSAAGRALDRPIVFPGAPSRKPSS